MDTGAVGSRIHDCGSALVRGRRAKKGRRFRFIFSPKRDSSSALAVARIHQLQFCLPNTREESVLILHLYSAGTHLPGLGRAESRPRAACRPNGRVDWDPRLG